MTRRAADFARHCRAPLPGGPAAAEPRRLHFPGIRAFESKSALGPGGSPGPGPSTPRPRSRLALSARPWLPILPSGSLRRGGETSVQLFLDSPPSGRELPLRLRRRVQPRRGFYASWGQDWGRGCFSGRKERPRPTQEAPSRCLRREQAPLLSRLLPLSHGSSPKTHLGAGGRSLPEFSLWDW